jgi:hypothetical protein
MRKKWIIKQVDDDKVLHFLLKNKVFDRREDCIFMPLDSTANSFDNKDADIILLNPRMSEASNSNNQVKKAEENLKSSVILLVNSKKQLDQISSETTPLYIEKGRDSITKITNIIEDAIFLLYEKERNIRIAN